MMRTAVLLILFFASVASAQEMQRSPLLTRTYWLPADTITATDSLEHSELPAGAHISRVYLRVDSALGNVDSVSVTLDNGERVTGWVYSDGWTAGTIQAATVSHATLAPRRVRVRVYNAVGDASTGQLKIVIDAQIVD